MAKIVFFSDPCGLLQPDFEKAQAVNRAQLATEIQDNTCTRSAFTSCNLPSDVLGAIFHQLNKIPEAVPSSVESYACGAVNLLFRVPWLHYGQRVAGFIRYRPNEPEEIGGKP